MIVHASHPYGLPSRSESQRKNPNLSKSMDAPTQGKKNAAKHNIND